MICIAAGSKTSGGDGVRRRIQLVESQHMCAVDLVGEHKGPSISTVALSGLDLAVLN